MTSDSSTARGAKAPGGFPTRDPRPPSRRPLNRRPGNQCGTTLVEALVAFLVLAFGVLALARIQAALRLSADTARHRSEAVRLAQEDIEHLRAFASIGAAPGLRSFADLVSASRRVEGGGGGAPVFTLVRSVEATSVASARSVRAEVRWTDRSGALQTVVLASVVAANDPALGGALAVAPAVAPTNGPGAAATP